MIQSRIERLSRSLADTPFDGIALNAGPSLGYFTGLNFHLMERPVVFLYLPEKEPVLVLPRMEARKVVEVEEQLRCFFYDENPAGWGGVFLEAARFLELGSKVIGIEPLGLRFFEYTMLQTAAGKARFIDGAKIISSLRWKKDADEISLMQKAVSIAEDALRQVIPLIRVGMTEKEIAGELVIQLLRHGSEPSLPFSPIVSGGPNGANPHAKPSERKISQGDLLVIDWGASYQGYLSDLTRTLAVGEIDDESRKIHDLVRAANAAGRAAGSAGAACAEVDRAARRVIEDGGYGRFFTHRTGHGIGKECHEEPYMRGDNEEPLQVGMTYTVEPGIYLPGRNGVRIEDDVLVSEEGPVSLSSFPRDIIEVG